ncbi:MAG: Lrp/AsnC family transcriptional regulator [Kineosporiaceae bacterium]
MPKEARPLTRGPAPRTPPLLDEVDTAIVAALVEDGRMSNVALAHRVGLAESTCIGRLRSLRSRGVIRGFSAEVDLARLGLGVQAMVAIRFSGHLREDVEAFAREVAQLPGVIATYNISGANDFLVHVAAPGPDTLRDFVLDNLTGRQGVVHAETSLIFQVNRGTAVVPVTSHER